MTRVPDRYDTKNFVDLTFIKVFCDHCHSIVEAPLSCAGGPIQCHSCQEYLIVPKQRIAPSVVISDFALKEVIGEGGAGVVYKAYQISLDRDCAIKILHTDHANDPEYLASLISEGRIAGKLNHPHVVQCYNIGQEEGIYFYAMEYIEGKSLKQLIEEKWRLSQVQALKIITEVVDALNYCWIKERMVHRDIKPDNIMITRDGDVKLTDMGLARSSAYNNFDPNSESIEGSPHYIAPEQILGEEQDFRSDIYSLGIVFYQCLTGEMPFNAPSPLEICKLHLEEDALEPTEHNDEINNEICELVLQMINKDKDDRFQDYGRLKAELMSCKLSVGISSSQEISRLHASQEMVRLSRDEQSKSRKYVNFSLLMGILIAGTVGWVNFSGSEKQSDAKPVPVEQAVLPEPDLITEVDEKESEPKKFLRISAIMIDPVGYDVGNEWIEIENISGQVISLDNYYLKDADGNESTLQGDIPPGAKYKLDLLKGQSNLNNSGDTVYLYKGNNEQVDKVDYTQSEITEGVELKRN